VKIAVAIREVRDAEVQLADALGGSASATAPTTTSSTSAAR
jgi:hypothetical protein